MGERQGPDLAGEAEVVGGAVELSEVWRFDGRVPYCALTKTIQYLRGRQSEEGAEGEREGGGKVKDMKTKRWICNGQAWLRKLSLYGCSYKIVSGERVSNTVCGGCIMISESE